MQNSEEKNVALNAFKGLLVPIVRDALQHNEAKGRPAKITWSIISIEVKLYSSIHHEICVS
jgi:hypothetical protein